MTEPMEKHETMTCGEFLDSQREALAGIGDLTAPGAVRKAEDCLANIYAVSYQMNFERREPPSPHRGPAEHEALDRALVADMAEGLKHKARVFEGISDDPRQLKEAVSCASRGNGFALIEMVNTVFLERGAGKGPAKSEGRQAEESRQEKRPVPAGPSL